MKRTPHTYNATCVGYRDGKAISWELVQYLTSPETGQKRVYRSNGHWTHNNGTEAYQDDWASGKAFFCDNWEILEDGGKAYKDRLRGVI